MTSRLHAGGFFTDPTTTVFRASSLQREYRRVLDGARIAPVPVLDNNELLAVERWSTMAFSHGVVAALEDIGQFHAAYAQHRENEPRSWVAMTPYPWLAALDREEVDEFAGELFPYLMESVHRGSLEAFVGNLRAWESTAETYDNPEMLAAMTTPFDGSALVEVQPPSEQAAEAADSPGQPAE